MRVCVRPEDTAAFQGHSWAAGPPGRSPEGGLGAPQRLSPRSHMLKQRCACLSRPGGRQLGAETRWGELGRLLPEPRSQIKMASARRPRSWPRGEAHAAQCTDAGLFPETESRLSPVSPHSLGRKRKALSHASRSEPGCTGPQQDRAPATAASDPSPARSSCGTRRLCGLQPRVGACGSPGPRGPPHPPGACTVTRNA